MLIKDFWTYTYNQKTYYGIVEVVAGDLSFRSIDKKYETHIEKAISYTSRPGVKMSSHMSIQSYLTYMKDSYRQDNEETYYPFFIEFESKKKPGQADFEIEYKKAVEEAERTVKYLIYILDVDEKDIMIMINNSRSIYILVNPKSYLLKPQKSKDLALIYKHIFNKIDDNLCLLYADKSLYKHNTLIKTPNSFYKGGYQVTISKHELSQLRKDISLKSYLTREKRNIDRETSCEYASGFSELYTEAVEEVKEQRTNYRNNREKKVKYPNFRKLPCIERIEKNIQEQGQRNQALVTLAIFYKSFGYSKEQVDDLLIRKAKKWSMNDESESSIKAISKTVFAKDYKFSCEYVKEYLDIDCSGCRKNQAHKMRFKIHKNVVDMLWYQKASLRHYRAYLSLSRKDLFNKWFKPENHDLPVRYIREFCKKANLKMEKNQELIYIENKHGSNAYLLPIEFVDDTCTVDSMGELLKHYLRLIFTGYKAADKYINMRVKTKRIQELLNYKNKSSVYRFLKILEKKGLLITKKGALVALYYSSNKIVDIKDRKEKKATQNQNTTQTIAVGAEKIILSAYKNMRGQTTLASMNKGSPF